jgi:hypothetical protein
MEEGAAADLVRSGFPLDAPLADEVATTRPMLDF